MRYDNFLSFIKHLDEGKKVSLSPVYLIVASDESMLNLLVNRARVGGEKVLDDRCLSKLQEELFGRSLFSSNSLVIKLADSPSKEVEETLLKYLSKIDEGRSLILAAKKLPKNSKLPKAVEKLGVAYLGRELKPWELEPLLVSWISYEAINRGVQIDNQTALELVKRCECDATLLLQELEKLICFAGRRAITRDDLAAISPEPLQFALWSLGEATLKRSAKCYKILEALLHQNVSSIAIVRALRGQYQTLLQVCRLLSLNREVAPDFPHLKGRILEKQIAIARDYSPKEATRRLVLIDEMESKLKSSSVTDAQNLDLLLSKLLV